MPRERIRIRFRKDGDLRLVSHHDLMRCFERMLRRAGLPFRSTEGFNPKPRLAFALSLGLGIVGCAEIVELELSEPIAPQEIQERLTRQAPAGLTILDVQAVTASRTAHVRGVGYRVAVPPEQTAGLPERIAEVLASSHCWVERVRPRPRRLDVRPYIKALHLVEGYLEMQLSLDAGGTARPEEILAILGIAACLEQGAILERTTLELEDEPVAALPE